MIAYLLVCFAGAKWIESLTVLFIGLTFLIQMYQYTFSTRERKFYEMMRTYQQNVFEFEIDEKITQKKVFIAILKEFMKANFLLNNILSDNNNSKTTPHEIFIVSYLIVFFGVGHNSNRMLKQLLCKYISSELSDKLISKLQDYKECSKDSNSKYSYTYFDGHQTRLGHYYRQLFNTINYLDSSNIFTNQQKVTYAKMLRTQMSTYEQSIFFINSITPLGLDWWSNDFIVKYGLVKNIPNSFFDKNEIDIHSYFPSKYFEWEMYEIKSYKFINDFETGSEC